MILNALEMLDYFKTILKKVSFDVILFEKELKKAIKSLVKKEIEELKMWCFNHFWDKHPQVLQKCFS